MMFKTEYGEIIPAVTEDQMREVDRIAMKDFGLGVLQMMENAGRNLALNVMDMLGSHTGEVTILAGSGGNGGGGICCARHLHNRGFKVHLILDRDSNALRGSALAQFRILEKAGLGVAKPDDAEQLLKEAEIVIDALIGYSLRGAPKGKTAELISLSNQNAARVLSLDLPSGMNATTGETPGVVIRPERTLTLALPKTGLRHLDGELYLADIGIPPEVYHPLDIHFEPFFGDQYWIPLEIIE
jgi:NAD(P)H-hydrate epimerase